MRLVLCVAGFLAVAGAAEAQTGSIQVSQECAGPITAYNRAANALLDSALHGEDAYNKVRNEAFDPAGAAALDACRLDPPAKQMIYATNSHLTSYQATRDAALQLLQQRPPTPVN